MSFTRVDDEFRDATGHQEPVPGASSIDQMESPANNQILTDPTSKSLSKTFTVPASGASSALASTPAFTIADEPITITSAVYVPASALSVPSSGNSRTWTLTAAREGAIAAFTQSSVGTAATSVTFSLSAATVVPGEVINLASTVAGSGVADPGGVLTINYTV